MRTGVFVSPSAHRAEHEVGRGPSGPGRGHRPSGREHELARFNVKRRLGANWRTGFDAGARKTSDRKYDEANQLNGETAQFRTGTPSVGRDRSLEKWPMRKGQADEVLRGVW